MEERNALTRRQPNSPEIYDPSVYMGYGQQPQETQDIHLVDYWRIIAARRWTVLAILLTSVAITLIWTLKQVPVYRATTSIQIDRENMNVLNFRGVYEIDSAADDSLRTQFEVLRSRLLARRVIEELKLSEQPEFQPKPPSLAASYIKEVKDFMGLRAAPQVNAGEPDQLRPLIDAYLRRLEISPVRQARLVNVGFELENPQLAARIINAHADNYIKQNLLFKWEASQEATKFLEDQLVNQKSSLESARDKIEAYKQQNEIMFTAEGLNTAEEKLRQLQVALTEARNDRFRKQSFYDQIHAPEIVNPAESALPQLMSDSLIASLTTQLADLRREESALTVQFGPKMEDVARARRKIEEADRAIAARKKQIISTIDSEYQIASRNEDFLTKDVARQTDVVNKINQELTQYEIMKSEVKTTEEMYQGLLNRSKENAVSAGLSASNVRVVDKAEVPGAPIRPRKSLNVMLSMVVGLVLGVGTALLLNYLDDTFKSPQDVGRFLNVPVLGVVPKLSSVTGRFGYAYGYGDPKAGQLIPTAAAGQKSRIELMTHEAPSSILAEAYRSVRTSLLLSSADSAPRTILVTSSQPSEGKTVTAINIAVSLTQTGARVVLVDADMRKPRIHSALTLENNRGLSSFLTGSATLKDVIVPCSVPDLHVIPCGVVPPNPAELVLSARFRQLLQVLGEYFDYVVIDTPPVNSVSDARILATACDSVVMVVKASSTSRHQARQALDHLTQPQTRVAGVILNDLDVRQRSYYGSDYYYASTYSGKAS